MKTEIINNALEEIGKKEIVGAKHNPRILQYFKTVGHSWVKNDETAWCAAFVGFILEKSGINSTKKLNARSYLKFGESTSNPTKGDIVVFWRNGKNSAYGHVAFFIRQTKNWIWVLGGNQNNEVNISKYHKTRLLDYRTF